MKWKRLTTLLVAVMFLTLLLPTSKANASNVMSVDQTSCLVGDIVKVTLTDYSSLGITDANAFVGLYHYGDLDTANPISRGYVRNMNNLTYDIKMPNDLGNYEIRLCAIVNRVLMPLERLGVSVTSNPANEGDLSLSLDKLLIVDPLTITVKGFSKGQIDAGAWIGIFHKDSALSGNPVSSVAIRNLQGKTDWAPKTPTVLGEYEVRAFTMNTAADKRDAVLYGTVPFSVISSTANEGDLTISKDSFLVNEEITVTIQGLTQGQISNGAWAGLFKQDTDINKSTSTRVAIANLPSGGKWVIAHAPTELGNYEIRVFTQNASSENQASVLFGKIPFTVVSLPAKSTDVKLAAKVFGTIEEFKVTVTGLSPGQISAGAWMGIYRPGDALSVPPLFSKWVMFRNLRDLKTWSLKPKSLAPGKYQLRIFTQNTAAESRGPVVFAKVDFSVVEGINWDNYTLSVVPASTVNAKVNGPEVKVTAYATHKTTHVKINADSYVIFKIENSSIAYVTGKGYVTGTKAGTVKLKVTTKNGKTPQIKSLTVNVKN